MAERMSTCALYILITVRPLGGMCAVYEHISCMPRPEHRTLSVVTWASRLAHRHHTMKPPHLRPTAAQHAPFLRQADQLRHLGVVPAQRLTVLVNVSVCIAQLRDRTCEKLGGGSAAMASTTSLGRTETQRKLGRA